MIIDSHAHFIQPRLFEAIQDSAGDFPALELLPDGQGSFGFAFAGNKPTRPASKMLSDTKGRLDWMDSNGIDLQVIGGWLDMFGYEMPANQGRQWASMINQHLKETIAHRGKQRSQSSTAASLNNTPAKNIKQREKSRRQTMLTNTNFHHQKQQDLKSNCRSLTCRSPSPEASINLVPNYS